MIFLLAHEVLSDENKRKIYDRYGEDGLKDQAGFDSSSFHFNVKDFFKDFNFDFGKSSFFSDDNEFGDSFFGNHFEFHSSHHNHNHQQHHNSQHHHNMNQHQEEDSDNIFGNLENFGFDFGGNSFFQESSFQESKILLSNL